MSRSWSPTRWRTGRARVFATVAGASVGNALLVAGGAAGLTAVLALLVPVFEWVRWGGAFYLIWLGLRSWRAAFDSSTVAALRAKPGGRGVFWQGVMVALTNPKTILFYAAFFPQFVSPSLPPGPQIAAMSVAMLGIAILSDCAYALIAGRLRPWLVRHARVHHAITGTLLVGTGIGLAAMTKEVQALRPNHNYSPDTAIRDVATALRKHVDEEIFDRVLMQLLPGATEFWRVD